MSIFKPESKKLKSAFNSVFVTHSYFVPNKISVYISFFADLKCKSAKTIHIK